jgi:hypothetical protein
MFAVNLNSKNRLAQIIKGNMIAKRMRYEKKKGYVLDFPKKIYFKGLTKGLKKKWFENDRPFSNDKLYEKSNLKLGKKIHASLFKYIKTGKFNPKDEYTRKIVGYFKEYNEIPIASEVPCISSLKKKEFATQVDLIVNKGKKLIMYELKSGFCSKSYKSKFKSPLRSTGDSKLNRAYLQLLYTEYAFKKTYNTKIDESYVLNVFSDKKGRVEVDRIENPNWFKRVRHQEGDDFVLKNMI